MTRSLRTKSVGACARSTRDRSCLRGTRARLVLVVLLLASCHRTPPRERRPNETPAVPFAPLFREVAPGITLAELERRYDDHVAEIDLVRLTVARVALVVRPLDDRRFSPLFADESVDVAINGGFFEPDFTPSGLVISEGVALAPRTPRGGSGILVVTRDRARIVASESAGDDVALASLAIQCGPRLIEPDGSIGIQRDSGQRAARTAVCVRDEGRTLDLVVARRVDGPGGPSLLDLARWLDEGLVPGEPGCEAALNLDGGPSTALFVRSNPSAQRLPPGPVVHALVARGRRNPP